MRSTEPLSALLWDRKMSKDATALGPQRNTNDCLLYCRLIQHNNNALRMLWESGAVFAKDS
jgi:hypothetical protein